jgi:aspartate kinase
MHMNTIVMKFGGTSVADAGAVARVRHIVTRVQERTAGGVPPVVVVSAMSGVTDRLLALASAAERREEDGVARGVEDLWERHAAAATALTTGARRDALLGHLRAGFDDLHALLKATAILRSATPASRDAVASTGELLSSRLVAAAFEEAGLPAAWIDARRAVVTDDAHTAAVPLMDETREAVAREIAPALAAGRTAIVGGYVGATRQAVTTTLGRGGSDYSAAIVGAVLDAAEIQIWTDVDGMLTADPRIIDRPRVVPRLSFDEASELAYFGAKVLHPSTILPAVAREIPVRILNSRNPDAPGTVITARPAPHDTVLTALACKRRVTVIDITSTRMLMAHGFLKRLFDVFEAYQTAVDVVTTSEVSVSMTVDDDSRLEPLVAALQAFAEVRIERDMAILCAVGDTLRAEPRIASRVLGAIEEFPFRMVSQAASRRNVTVVLRDDDVAAAMSRLHERFFEGVPVASGLSREDG